MGHYDSSLALTAPYHHVFQKISDKALGMTAHVFHNPARITNFLASRSLNDSSHLYITCVQLC